MTFTLSFSHLDANRKKAVTFTFVPLTRVFGVIERWRQHEISRAAVSRLDSNLLKDMGITEAQRFIESDKPFWDV